MNRQPYAPAKAKEIMAVRRERQAAGVLLFAPPSETRQEEVLDGTYGTRYNGTIQSRLLCSGAALGLLAGILGISGRVFLPNLSISFLPS